MTLKNYGARVGSVCSYRCYVEEYFDRRGRICGRIRDKRTNKQVSLVTNDESDRDKFLEFLNSVKKQQDTMPDLYDRYGDDVITVKGVVSCESQTVIFVDVDNEHGSYSIN